MRVLKLAVVFILILAGGVLLGTNMRPQAEFVAVAEGYGLGDLQRLSQDLRIERLRFSTDPLGLGEDLLPSFSINPIAMMLVLFATGLIVGSILENVRARRTRRQLREKRDEAVMLRAELNRANSLLKASDHPASVLPPARR